MKIQVLSDLHLEAADLIDVPSIGDVVVLAGDIHEGAEGLVWAKEKFPGIPVIYVPGNHELYNREAISAIQNMRQAAKELGIVFLQDEAVVINNVRILGTTLWTDGRLHSGSNEKELMWDQVAMALGVPDYGRVQVGQSTLTPRIAAEWHQTAVTWLEQQLAEPFAGPTVVVTHHAPSACSIPDEFEGNRLSPAYASRLEHLVEMSDLWIHGHVHATLDYRIGKARVVANPRGYGDEVPDFDPAFVVEI